MSTHEDDEHPGWPVLIGAMVLLKQQLAELDPAFPFVPPRLGATEDQLAAVEERWGPLEAGYRDFLAHVDGWEDFLWGAALLDTAALLEPANALALATYHEQCGLEPEQLVLEHVMPLGTPDAWGSLAMMGRAGTPLAGQVIEWTSSSGGSRSPTFYDYFLDCLATYERAVQGEGARPVTFGERSPGDSAGGRGGPGTGDPEALARLVVRLPAKPWPWATLVRALGGLKSVLATRGVGELWSSPAPSGASEEQLCTVRDRWGAPLDAQHADLLRAADGWPLLLVSIDLLSTDQLTSRDRMLPAVTHLRAVVSAQGGDADELLVLASSAPEEEGHDTVVVSRSTGKVLWLRGHEVVREHRDVRAWMVDVIGHHLTEIKTTPTTLHSPL